MILRRTKRRLGIGLLLIACGWLIIKWRQPAMTSAPAAAGTPSSSDPFVRSAVRTTAYALSPDEWIEFPIPHNSAGLRLLTNAGVAADSEQPGRHFDRRPGWTYRIRLRAVDRSEQVVWDTSYNFRVQLSNYVDPPTGENYYSSFFTDSSLIPSRTQSMRLPWVSNAAIGPCRWQIRLEAKSPGVEQVYLRAYTLEERPRADRSYAWQRLSEQRRRALCRATLYDHQLVTPQERQQLLRWMWTALTPTDLKVVQQRRQFIYTLEDLEYTEADGDAPAPSGIEVSANRAAVISLPAEFCRFRLDFESLAGPSSHDPPTSLVSSATIRWFSDVDQKVELLTRDLQDDLTSLPLPWSAGVLEVTTTTPQTIRLYGCSAEPEVASPGEEAAMTEVTPDASYLRAFLAGPGSPVEYEIAHVGELPTPFQLAVRHVAASPGPPPAALPALAAGLPPPEPSAAFRWQFYDSQGQLLKEDICQIAQPWSVYDRISTPLPDDRITEAERVFWSLSARVARVRIESVRGALAVAAYSQPPDLPARTRVPHDYLRTASAASNARIWFLMSPVEQRKMTEDGRSCSVRIQQRPPTHSAAIAAGDYAWESLLPDGLWSARPLLVPRVTEYTRRPEAQGSTYYELATGQPVAVRLIQPSAFPWNHKLIYYRDGNSSSPLRLILDNQSWTESTLLSRQGEIALPLPAAFSTPQASVANSAPGPSATIAAGGQTAAGVGHTLRVEAARETRVFLNGLEVDSRQPRYTKRLALRIGPGRPLTFSYDKSAFAAESLTLHFYAPPSNGETEVADSEARSYARNPLGTNATSGATSAEASAATSWETITVAVSIQAPPTAVDTPFAAWTTRERLFEIEPGDTSASLVLQDRGATVDEGNACYLTLDGDLPPAAYRIHVRQLTGGPGYVILSRTSPGAAAAVQLWTEAVEVPEYE